MIAASLALLVALSLVLVLLLRARSRRGFRRPLHPPEPAHGYARRKPDWVRGAVIRLKARMPHEGCRHIASAFNSLNGASGQTVGKSFVADTIKRNAVQVLLERRRLNRRLRRQGARNVTWAMDISFARQKPVLGILDHGTRGLLLLSELRTRTAIGVLRAVLDTIETFGAPRFLRTDNESIFTSRFFAIALFILGIRHQRIDPFCPWQNGRIERLFGALKPRLRAWWQRAGVPDDLQHDLDTFRAWYNHARPHQSLQGLTPAMAWAGITRHARPPRFFSAWDGVLTGFVTPT